MRWASVVVAAGVVGLVACSSSTSLGGGGGGHSTTITVGNDFFSPTPDTVPAGQVTFTWATPSNGHNVTWDTGPGGLLPLNSSTMASGTYTAGLQPGTYTYHCTIHVAQGMRGTVVVQ